MQQHVHLALHLQRTAQMDEFSPRKPLGVSMDFRGWGVPVRVFFKETEANQAGNTILYIRYRSCGSKNVLYRARGQVVARAAELVNRSVVF